MSNQKTDQALLLTALMFAGLGILKLGVESDKHKARLDQLEAERDYQALNRLNHDMFAEAKKAAPPKKAAAPRTRKTATAKTPRLAAVK